MKRILAITLALTMLLALTACGASENTEPEVTTRATLGSEDASVTASVTEDEAEPGIVGQEDIVAVFEGVYSYTEREFTTGTYESNGGVEYILENDQYISIYEYGSEEAAAQVASQFDAGGTTFYGSDGSITEYEFVYPMHFWLNGSCIISYCSETGEFLQDFNAILGTEFAGAGSDYFRPTYVNDLVYALWDAGYNVSFKYCSGTGQTYLKDTVSACILVVSNGEAIYFFEYEDEYEALDEAARYAIDAETYSGEDLTIGIAYEEPVHFYLNDSVIARYSSESGELLSVISSVYGYQFAGADYDYDGEKPWYETGSVEFDYITAPAENSGAFTYFPQSTVIRSTDELENLREELDLTLPLYVDTTWEMMTYKYSDEWFKSNDLILILLYEPSGSINPYVTDVVRNADRSYTVSLSDDYPEAFTDDEAYWYIFVEITGTKIYPLTQVEVVSSRD